MQLASLLDRLKMEHLQAQLDPICEQASKADLDYKAFLAQALDVEWRGRYQHGVESGDVPTAVETRRRLG